jgi:hypothetical protein
MPNDAQTLPERNGAAAATDASAEPTPIVPERSAATLVHGIIADVQRLIEQQLSMFRQETQDAIRKVLSAGLALATGVGITVAGGVMLLMMLPLLLNWLTPELPLWACFGIVGGVLAATGGICVYLGARKIQSCHPLSNQAVEALKENFTWKTNTK